MNDAIYNIIIMSTLRFFCFLFIAWIEIIPSCSFNFTKGDQLNPTLCTKQIGLLYPYVLFETCGQNSTYFLQKYPAHTDFANYHMDKLYPLINLQIEILENIITLQIVQPNHIVLILSYDHENQTLNFIEVDANKFLYLFSGHSKPELLLQRLLNVDVQLNITRTSNSKWAVAFNGTTFKVITLSEYSAIDEEKWNLKIRDSGYNSERHNPIYQITILKKYLKLDSIHIFEIGICPSGNFFLFMGNHQIIKIFAVSLFYFLPSQHLNEIQFFAILNHSYCYAKENQLFFYEIGSNVQACRINVTESVKLTKINDSIQICEEDCVVVDHLCQQIEVEVNQTEENETSQNSSLLELQKKMLFPYDLYHNSIPYCNFYADRLMAPKLKTIIDFDEEEFEESENNCQLIVETVDEKSHPTDIIFKPDNEKWKICRVGFISNANYIVFGDQTKNITKPYKLIVCKFHPTGMPLQKCDYIETVLDRKKLITSNLYQRVYVLNQGQTYNITLVDMNKEEIKNIQAGFFYLMLMIFFILFIVICKSVISFLCLYYGWSQSEPRYHYPLHPLQLKIKLKRLKEKGYLSYHRFRSSTEGEITCCFCLQQLQNRQKIIELYCRHQFHASCFENWVKSEEFCKCPVCKRGFTEEELDHYRQSRLSLKEDSSKEIEML